MPEPVLTETLMTEILRERALKICQLSLEITTRQMAQAWAELHAHINTFTADVLPVDASASGNRHPLAKLNLALDHYDFHSPHERAEYFRERLTETDQYIAYLNLLLAQGKVVTVEATRGAA